MSLTSSIRSFTRGRSSAAALLAVLAGAAAAGACAPPKPLLVDAPPAVRAGVATRKTVAVAAAGEYRAKRLDYWHSISELDFDVAELLAVNDERRLLARSLLMLTMGDDERAETVLDTLRRQAGDPLVRRVAFNALIATLQHRSAWRSLFEFTRVRGAEAATPTTVTASAGGVGAESSLLRPDATAMPTRDLAGVDVWAEHLLAAPEERYDFPDAPVVLPLRRSLTGVPMIEARMGQRVVDLWLDTGSSFTILAGDVADVFGVVPLGHDTLAIATATGREPARPGTVPHLQLGGLTIEHARATIVAADALRLEAPDGSYVGIDGVLGTDVLRHLDIELDYANGRATFRRPAPPDPSAQRNLYWFGFPVVRLLAGNGARVHFALDTGADETVADSSLLTKAGVRALRAERRHVSGIGGRRSTSGRVITGLTLNLAGTPLRLERVFVSPGSAPTMFSLDGTLGSDVGAGDVVRIDMTNGIFAVHRAGAPPVALAPGREAERGMRSVSEERKP